MTKKNESLPRSAGHLERLAAHYDEHDTTEEMAGGEWVDPRPMVMTSLRLSAKTVDALKDIAGRRGVRYTAFLREVLENAAGGSDERADELLEIRERLARIENAISAPMDIVWPRLRVRVDGATLRRARGATVRIVRRIAG
ncbi:BrnA antitoxin family protein [Allokutzneria sp. A3M-2-11 16]|uniref:BrnA antitoxin family protein n=1 Tax=Allokutzneria sp. A3M-2-11 16 TaxID=2962043 RepID=UPI0020B7EB2E|nr:BrnA antitoxin family protein [Allokutzneria sp. A3M-2-11 16]MCP3799970.1 BrnA antitoxin family protein [Allokutzneria sp. A3M-2-11 16]